VGLGFGQKGIRALSVPAQHKAQSPYTCGFEFNTAFSIEDMNLPGLKLHELKGELKMEMHSPPILAKLFVSFVLMRLS
jgi:hypothetical protein